VVAAGALVWRERGDGVQVLLIHRPRHDDWSLPKGKLDKGETAPAAAVREVVEETGYRVRLRRPLPPSAYLLPDGRTKVVHYWAATVRAKVARGPQSRREVDDVHWVPLEEAMQRVTRQSDQVPVEALRRHLEADELETAPIVIQRHGAALSRSKWRKGEDTRPLNKKGRKQARALPPLLDAFDPSSVLSSPWERCRATVEPLATVEGLTLRTDGRRDRPRPRTGTADGGVHAPTGAAHRDRLGAGGRRAGDRSRAAARGPVPGRRGGARAAHLRRRQGGRDRTASAGHRLSTPP